MGISIYTRRTAACGVVPVTPPTGWPNETQPRGGWVVGGCSYPTWKDAYMGAIAPPFRGSDDSKARMRPPSSTAYFRRKLWAVYDAEAIAELAELLSPRLQQQQQTAAKKGPGIDLSKRGIEVRKLLYAGFGLRMAKAGYDPEDVLQEVYRGILVRNEGKCPFDPTKASFGHYVHMVISCILSNYHRKESQRKMQESSWEDLPDGKREVISDGGGRIEENGDEMYGVAVRRMMDAVRCFPGLTEREEELALGVLPHLAMGLPPTAKGAKEAGWAWADWRDGVAVLRRVAS